MSRNAHTAFIERLAQLRKDYDESGGSLTVIIDANKMIIDWLTQHISRMDKRIGEYVREKISQEGSGSEWTAGAFL